MKYSKVPKWLLLQEKIDFSYFQLKKILGTMPKSILNQEIDIATGYDAARRKDIIHICRRMKKLKQQWANELEQKVDTTMEDQLIEAAKLSPQSCLK